MDASSHPVVIEYAVRECFKHKSPRTAAQVTSRKLRGLPNLFIGGGNEVVEIDVQQLENRIWLRMAERASYATKHVKPGYEAWAVEGVLQEFGQPVTANTGQLVKTMKHLESNLSP